MKDSFIDKSVKEEPLMATMRYINDNLLSLGVKVGDEVCFTPESEYEFTVDGERLYRVFDHQITIVL
jgi:co-chaperonin GroES (HSP10)